MVSELALWIITIVVIGTTSFGLWMVRYMEGGSPKPYMCLDCYHSFHYKFQFNKHECKAQVIGDT